MSTTTLPHATGTDRAPRIVSPSDGLDPRTDDGLRQAVRAVGRSGSWDQAAGRRLLGEIRRRAVRNAAHVAAATGVLMGRGLVDDVLLAAWTVLHRHGDKVLAAERSWAYLMSSAQKQVLDEVRAHQLLTNTASIRGRAREVLPGIVRPVGTTASDLAAAFRHESRGEGAGGTERQVVPQIGRHDQAPLVAPPTTATGDEQPAGREAWFVAFVDLLVDHGADKTATVAAVDRLADLFTASYVGWWEWAARRDPILAHLGLSPDQCGALVALLATCTGPDSGSRARAAKAGQRGGRASSQLSRGGNLSPLPRDASPQVNSGDNMSPLEAGPRGDNTGGSGVTNRAVRGDNRVTRTVIEPSPEPSSFPPAPARALAPAVVAGGGIDSGIVAEVLDVLPEPVRDHPSIVPSAIARRVQALDQRGWPRPQIRERLVNLRRSVPIDTRPH